MSAHILPALYYFHCLYFFYQKAPIQRAFPRYRQHHCLPYFLYFALRGKTKGRVIDLNSGLLLNIVYQRSFVYNSPVASPRLMLLKTGFLSLPSWLEMGSPGMKEFSIHVNPAFSCPYQFSLSSKTRKWIS